MYRNHILAICHFALSTLFTWWFVMVSPLYISNEQMVLSTVVAGGKWAIQIIAALMLLSKRRWEFVREIGFVCLAGSCVLLPYVLFSILHWSSDARFFVGSLVVAVVLMIILYHKAVKLLFLPSAWWYGWLVCLCIAVSLQLTIVFHVL